MSLDLDLQLSDLLSSYSDEITETVNRACSEAAAEAVKTLQQTSPNDKGKYACNWKYRVTATDWAGAKTYTVYNMKTHYITHLLENGHLNRDGSRTKAQPHIAPAEQDLIDNMPQSIGEAIRLVR